MVMAKSFGGFMMWPINTSECWKLQNITAKSRAVCKSAQLGNFLVNKYYTKMSISWACAVLVYMCQQGSFQVVHCCHFCCGTSWLQQFLKPKWTKRQCTSGWSIVKTMQMCHRTCTCCFWSLWTFRLVIPKTPLARKEWKPPTVTPDRKTTMSLS